MDGYRPGVLVVLAVLLFGLIAGWVAGSMLAYFVSPLLGYNSLDGWLTAFLTANVVAPFGAAGASLRMIREVQRNQR
jgi:hypothetical protein